MNEQQTDGNTEKKAIETAYSDRKDSEQYNNTPPKKDNLKNIPIAQFMREFKELSEGQKLKFTFAGEQKHPSDFNLIHKEQIRYLKRVETKNIITIRELDNKPVWLYQPKKDTIFKHKNYNQYILKNYLFDGNDLIIEVLQ